MSEKTHICLDCETASRSFEVNLNTKGECEQCGSQSVIDRAIALSLAERALNKQEKSFQSPPEAGANDSKRSLKRQQRIENFKSIYAPIRRFLIRSKLFDVDVWWDGFSAWVDTSFDQSYESGDEPTEGECDWLRLVLANSDGRRKILYFHFDPEVEDMRTIVDAAKRS